MIDMRSYDELMASECVIDWTPAEMRAFCQNVMTDTRANAQLYARTKLMDKFAELRQPPLEALYKKSEDELNAMLEASNQAMVEAMNGVYDYESE